MNSLQDASERLRSATGLSPLVCISWLAGWSGALKTQQREASENNLKYLVAISSTPALMGLVSQQTNPPRRLNLALRK